MKGSSSGSGSDKNNKVSSSASLSASSQFVKDAFKNLDSRSRVEMDPTKSLKLYLRSAELLYKQAVIYLSENDFEKGYILLLKYCVLGISHLPKHPEYTKPMNEREVNMLKRNLLDALDRMDVLKPKLIQYYQNLELKIKREKEAVILKKKKEEEENAVKNTRVNPSGEQRNISNGVVQGHQVQNLEPTSVDSQWWLASQQFHSPNPETVSRTQSSNVLSDAMPAVFPSLVTPPIPSLSTLAPLSNTSTAFHQNSMPIVTASEAPSIPSRIELPHPPIISHQSSSLIPSTHQQYITPVVAPPSVPPPIPKKPEHINSLLFTDGFGEYGGSGLRKLTLPQSLTAKFIKIAEPNTKKGLETCGILCGILKSNQLHITTLLIPKQSATPNSCQTTDEMELFEYQDKHQLMTFGWIHTHPTQTCFMSSVDLHTHCSYQLMLPEAIAIVMAPSKSPSQGIFHLTDPLGLEVISECRDPAMFHPHQQSDDQLYEKIHEGHVAVVDNDFDVVDLR